MWDGVLVLKTCTPTRQLVLKSSDTSLTPPRTHMARAVALCVLLQSALSMDRRVAKGITELN